MNTQKAPTLGKLLGALIYDILVVSGLIMGILVLAIVSLTALDMPRQDLPAVFGRILWIVLIGSGMGYFVYSWRRGGQTLGLRAWKLQLVNIDGNRVTLKQCWVRALVGLFSVAAAGLGILWLLTNKERRTWHDLAAHTKLVLTDDPRS